MSVEEELTSLYQLYAAELFFYLKRLCGNDDTAEDLLQDVFIAALKYHSDSVFNKRAWLYKIARNLCFRERKKEKLIDYTDCIALVADNRQTRLTEDKIFHEEILQGLEKKNPLYREIYVLKIERNMQMKDICLILEIPDRTLSRHIQNIKKIILKNFKEEIADRNFGV